MSNFWAPFHPWWVMGGNRSVFPSLSPSLKSVRHILRWGLKYYNELVSSPLGIQMNCTDGRLHEKDVIYSFLWAGKTEMVYLFYSQISRKLQNLPVMYVCLYVCVFVPLQSLQLSFKIPALVPWSLMVVSFGKLIDLSDPGSVPIPAAGNSEELSWKDQRKDVAFYWRQTWSLQAWGLKSLKSIWMEYVGALVS